MASSSFTTNLGLCQWKETDRPKRADFISDNQIIDNVLGSHIADTAQHLSAAEKAKIATPYDSIVYAGTGTATRSVTTDFPPRLVIVYKKSAPPTVYADGVNVINAACSAYGNGGSAGLSINSAGFSVQQQSTASDGVRINLNESGSQYCAIIFK